LLGGGALLCLLAAALFMFEIWNVERQQKHQKEVRAFLQKKGLSERFVPQVKGSTSVELSAVAGSLGGISLLLLGWTRRREERQSPHFFIGADPRTDVQVSEKLLPGRGYRFPLVRHTKDGYALCLSSSMRGTVVASDGTRRTVKQLLVDNGRANGTEGNTACLVPIESGLKAAIQLGSHRFEIDTTAAGRPFAAPADRPWRTYFYYGASFVGHGVLMLVLFAMPDESIVMQSRSDGISQRYRRMAVETLKNAVAERKPPRPAKKKPLEKNSKQTKKHENKKSAVASHERDERLEPQKDPGAGKPGPAGFGGRNAGITGVLGRMSGKTLASVFGRESAISQEAENSLSALVGNPSTDPYALGGPGGGRNGNPSGTGGIGLGTWGFGPGQNGPGGGTFGPRGPGGYRIKKHRTEKDIVTTGRVVLDGTMSRKIIRRVIQRHLAEVRYCYVSKGLAADSKLSGMVKMQFIISANGRVTSAAVLPVSTLHHPATERCIRRAVRRWRFPRTQSVVSVKYPFHFRPSAI
jgi:TonB family protein